MRNWNEWHDQCGSVVCDIDMIKQKLVRLLGNKPSSYYPVLFTIIHFDHHQCSLWALEKDLVANLYLIYELFSFTIIASVLCGLLRKILRAQPLLLVAMEGSS